MKSCDDDDDDDGCYGIHRNIKLITELTFWETVMKGWIVLRDDEFKTAE